MLGLFQKSKRISRSIFHTKPLDSATSFDTLVMVSLFYFTAQNDTIRIHLPLRNKNFHSFGQIIATSHEFSPPKGSWGMEIPLFQGNLGWWNSTIWPDSCIGEYTMEVWQEKEMMDLFHVLDSDGHGESLNCGFVWVLGYNPWNKNTWSDQNFWGVKNPIWCWKIINPINLSLVFGQFFMKFASENYTYIPLGLVTPHVWMG